MKFRTLYKLLGEALELGLINHIYICDEECVSWNFVESDTLGEVTNNDGKFTSVDSKDSIDRLIEIVIEGRNRWENYMR